MFKRRKGKTRPFLLGAVDQINREADEERKFSVLDEEMRREPVPMHPELARPKDRYDYMVDGFNLALEPLGFKVTRPRTSDGPGWVLVVADQGTGTVKLRTTDAYKVIAFIHGAQAAAPPRLVGERPVPTSTIASSAVPGRGNPKQAPPDRPNPTDVVDERKPCRNCQEFPSEAEMSRMGLLPPCCYCNNEGTY